MKEISLDASVYSLIEEYPDIKDIMYGLGFEAIVNPLLLKTIGKKMTLRKGSENKNIDLNLIISKFREKGYLLK